MPLGTGTCGLKSLREKEEEDDVDIEMDESFTGVCTNGEVVCGCCEVAVSVVILVLEERIEARASGLLANSCIIVANAIVSTTLDEEFTFVLVFEFTFTAGIELDGPCVCTCICTCVRGF